MPQACLRFYEELNDFLPAEQRKKALEISFTGKQTIMDAIKSFGVPPAAVDLVLVNGRSVNFQHPVRNRDRISVYPMFETLNVTAVSRLRAQPLRRTRFVADPDLVVLAQFVRVLGFDVHCDPSLSPEAIIEISRNEDRIILTKDQTYRHEEDVTRALFLTKSHLQGQVLQLLDRLDIRDQARPFTRCPLCNNLLIKERIDHQETISHNGQGPGDITSFCCACERVPWEGDRLKKMIMSVHRILSRKP